MKETTQPPKDPKKKLWIGYAVILAIVILSNLFLFPAVMQASVKSVNYSTFLQMLESKELESPFERVSQVAETFREEFDLVTDGAGR